MHNHIDRQRWETKPTLAGDRFRNEPSPWSKEGRKIALSNRQALVDAHDAANQAAVQHLVQELRHALKLADMKNEHERVLVENNYIEMEGEHVMNMFERLMNSVERRSLGQEGRELEYQDVYRAIKAGRLTRLAMRGIDG